MPDVLSTLPSTDSRPVILVVDDDANIADIVRLTVEAAGMIGVEAHSGAEATQVMSSRHIDLIVLDVLLGDTDGFTLVEKLRQQGFDLPILFLTAMTDLPEKLRGLTLGDDYMTKPFRIEEITARIAILLRRRTGEDHKMVVGDLVLNEDNYTACRAGQDLLLTPTEFRLLRLLMRNSPRVVLRSEILNEVWSEEMRGRANVDTYVSYLRKKIDGARARENQMLVTKRGFGYKIIPAL